MKFFAKHITSCSIIEQISHFVRNDRKGFLLVVGLLCLSFSSDNNYFTLQKTFSYKANKILADHLGNYYLLGDYKVQKVNRFDSLLQFYQRKNLGTISLVDVSNPMKILVYFNNYRLVEMLDNNLTSLREFKLDDYGDMQVNAVCGSSTNGIWLYDENTAQLLRISDQGELIRQSISTRQSMNAVLHISTMIERNGYVYATDSSLGVAVFDMFGAYSKTIPIKGVQEFNVMQDQLIYFQDKKMENYNFQTFALKELTLPDSISKDAELLPNKLITLTNDSVKVYSY